MFYLKINEKIRSLLDLCTNLKFGCRDYCRYQIIALDELELLRIELANQNLKILTSEEFNEIKNSTEKVYFHYTHVCIHDNKISKEKKAEEILKDEMEEETNFNNKNNNCENNTIDQFIKTDSLKERKKPDVIAKFRVSYDFTDKKDEEDKFSIQGNKIKETENTFSYGLSMIASFFLLVLGSYYLGRDYLEWSPASTLKLTLVVTIVVFFAEAFLLIIKLGKQEDNTNVKANDKIKKYSLAYQLNQKYRNSFLNTSNYKKINDANLNKAKKE